MKAMLMIQCMDRHKALVAVDAIEGVTVSESGPCGGAAGP